MAAPPAYSKSSPPQYSQVPSAPPADDHDTYPPASPMYHSGQKPPLNPGGEYGHSSIPPEPAFIPPPYAPPPYTPHPQPPVQPQGVAPVVPYPSQPAPPVAHVQQQVAHVQQPVVHVQQPMVQSSGGSSVVVVGQLPPGVCAVCRKGKIRNSATGCTYCWCILCLLCGILPGIIMYLCACRKPKCSNCGYSP